MGAPDPDLARPPAPVPSVSPTQGHVRAANKPQLKETNINASIPIGSREGRPINLDLVGDDEHALCGDSPGPGFEFVIEAEPRHEFLRLGTDALRTIDAAADESEEVTV